MHYLTVDESLSKIYSVSVFAVVKLFIKSYLLSLALFILVSRILTPDLIKYNFVKIYIKISLF